MLLGVRRDNQRWTQPGGHLEPGEDPLAGAVRELEEESGIRAKATELKHVATKTKTKRDGEKIQINAYVYAPKQRPTTSMRADPDLEVRRWHWVDLRRGLAPQIAEKLHVPLGENVLFNALGVAAMEKKAFWVGFEKRAHMLPASLAAAVVPSALGRGAVAGAKKLVRANPLKTLGGAAALGAGGYAAGRNSAPV